MFHVCLYKTIVIWPITKIQLGKKFHYENKLINIEWIFAVFASVFLRIIVESVMFFNGFDFALVP